MMTLALLSLACATLAADDEFLHLVMNGDIADIEAKLAKMPGLINAKDDRTGSSPIFIAAAHDRPDVTALLLKQGADVNIKTNDGSTPLHGAASLGNEVIAQLLLDAGADLEAETQDGYTPYLVAKFSSKRKMAKFLLASGAKKPAVAADSPRVRFCIPSLVLYCVVPDSPTPNGQRVRAEIAEEL